MGYRRFLSDFEDYIISQTPPKQEYQTEQGEIHVARFNGDGLAIIEVKNDICTLVLVNPRYSSNRDFRTAIESPEKFGQRKFESCRIRVFSDIEIEYNSLNSNIIQDIASTYSRTREDKSQTINSKNSVLPTYKRLV